MKKLKNLRERIKLINKFDGNLIFNVKKFHKETNRSKVIQSKIKIPSELKQFVVHKHANYIAVKNKWELISKRNCPYKEKNCGINEKKFLFQRLAFKIYECDNCKIKYLNPRIKEKYLESLYKKEKTQFKVLTSGKQKKLDILKYKYGLNIIESFSKEKDKIVDLGCGPGSFLNEASKKWKTCYGIDLNIGYKKYYKKYKNVKFILSDFEKLDEVIELKNTDCVTMWNVFEHIYYPGKILKKINSILKKNGLVFLVVPNSNSLITKLSRNLSPTFNWQHIFHYNKESLIQIMNKYGFKHIFLESIISEINNVKSYLSGEYPYSGVGDKEKIFDHINPFFIHKNLLGSRLLGVFKKFN